MRARVERSLEAVLAAIKGASMHAKTLTILEAVSSVKTYDPLRLNEFIILGFALTRSMVGQPPSALPTCWRFASPFDEPMATSAIYRTVEKLCERSLLRSCGSPPAANRTGRDPELFAIQPGGAEVFWISLCAHRAIVTSRVNAA